MKELFKKTEQGLIPASEEAMDLFNKIPTNELCQVEYIKKRNYKNLQRFMKFINVAFDMQDFYDNKTQFRKSVQMIGGHYEELIIIGRKGEESTVQFIPKSINFEEMDELKFQPLFKRCVTGYLNRYGTGMTEQEFMRIIAFD